MKTKILLVIIPLLLTACNKSTGTRIGVITKFNKTGWFNPTWEGDLSLNQVTNQANAQGVWSFSVADGPIVKEVQTAMETGKRVRITYEKVSFNGASETSYKVTGCYVIPD